MVIENLLYYVLERIMGGGYTCLGCEMMHASGTGRFRSGIERGIEHDQSRQLSGEGHANQPEMRN